MRTGASPVASKSSNAAVCATALGHNHVDQSAYPNLPSPRESGEGHFMAHHRGRVAGDSLGRTPRDIPAFSITHGDWLKLSQAAFREHVGARPGAAKVLAAEIECSPKTTQSWLDGETSPAGILDLRAMNRVPAYAALKREIAAMESDMDPRLQAKYAELHRLTLELAGPLK